MTVRAIQSNSDNGMLSTVAITSATGAGVGYLSKYMLPIQEQEKDANYRKILKIARVESAKIKADEIDAIRNVKNKSLAQDTFIKMIDNKEKINITNINAKIKSLGGQKSVDAIEFKNIISHVNESAATMSRHCISAYEGVVKRLRPTTPFVVAGALTGMFAGIAHNVLKTNTSV